ncbi:MAG: HAD hydrolase family protein [Planctomycetes bacterium]|nr:HAD hydrolase family protein [Phycisphaerae bacterium]NBB96293.1 HAD hydrolase family protein [Planctomycetota bacterium]
MCEDPANIRLLILDVDGVLTDGRIILGPDGHEHKAFNVKDGSGVKYWRRVGRTAAIITGRSSEVVQRRAKELGIEIVRQGAKNKLPVLQEIVGELDMPLAEVGVIGDDLTDLPILRACGFSAAPADAVEEVRNAVSYTCWANGGRGCVREVIEYLLKRSGDWSTIMQRYLPQTDTKDAHG